MTRVLFFLFLAVIAHAQETAALSGTIYDSTDSLLQGAEIRISLLERKLERTTTSDDSGFFRFDQLPPGTYSLTVHKEGFQDSHQDQIILRSRDRQTLRLRLAVEALKSEVTVEDKADPVSTDASTGMAIDQDSLRHLPVNGRAADSLVRLTPGVTAGASPDGGFNVNGLRSNANYYTVDGVSANQSAIQDGGGGPGPGGPPGGAPGANRSATNDLSLDSLQEIRVQTSTFAPEFGRTPGAQISLTTRGGTNDLHGTLFEYFRNERFNANEWFANRAGLNRGVMRQNQYGGTIGGRLIKDRTFFFASWESQDLVEPATTVANVPSLETRQKANLKLKPYLNAFPIPNGKALTGGAAEFNAVFSSPSHRDSASLRIDHLLSARQSLFFRYSWTPSSNNGRSSFVQSPNMVTRNDSRSHTGTLGLISTPRPSVSNDLRLNVSTFRSSSSSSADNYGGAVPLTASQVLPTGVAANDGSFSINVIGLSGYSVGQRSHSNQSQWNVVDGLTLTAGTHQYKLGADVRSTSSTLGRLPYSASAVFDGLLSGSGALLDGKTISAVVNTNLTSVYPSFLNVSFFVQDTYRLTPDTTLTYGIRWDINPAPSARQGPQPFALSSLSQGRVSQSEPLYNTRWTDLAPRFGISQRLGGESGHDLVFRGGFGAFRDIGYGTSSAAFSGAPYSSVRTVTSAKFPLTTSDAAPPTLPAKKPYGQISAAERNLQSPLIYQWNMTLEKHVGNGEVLTVSYVGTRGLRLLRTSMQPSFYDDFDFLRLATNGANSDYHGLQVQLQRRLARHLQLLVNYTWAHSIDTASNDSGGFGFASLFGGGDRGNSDYDIRHNLNITGSYLLPAPSTPIVNWLLRDWYTEWIATARTGLPFDVQGVSSTSGGGGLFAQVRPNFKGKSAWINDPSAPGGRRLDRNAFSTPGQYEQGNLARNALRGFGLSQVDFSLRRQFAIGERVRLNVVGQAYNVFNSSNFANPSPLEGANLSSTNFGVATRTVGQGFGGVGSTLGTGGPRSLQFSLRVQF